MPDTQTKPQIVCDECGATRNTGRTSKGQLRLPRGWKRHPDTVYCDSCWHDRYVLRAVTFPVSGPVDADWPEFRDALREAWADSTALHNWAMSQLYTRDLQQTILPARAEGATKCPPMARCYLYPEATSLFPKIPSVSVAGMLQAIERKYREIRYEVCWTGARSLPTHRYPTPHAAPNQSWRCEYDDEERPTVSIRIGERRWKLRLRGGRRRARQLAQFRHLANGSAVKGEIAIYRRRAGESKPDGGDRGRENGQRVSYDVMVKMVAWLPRPTRKDRVPREGTLHVRTAADALLIAVNDADERIWTLHFDHVRRWAAEHRRKLNAWSDDQKAEQRPDPSFAARRAQSVTKNQRRMDTAVKEAARQLANYAKRRRVCGVVYDDSAVYDASGNRFVDEFPWHALKERLRVALDEYRIEFRERADSG